MWHDTAFMSSSLLFEKLFAVMFIVLNDGLCVLSPTSLSPCSGRQQCRQLLCVTDHCLGARPSYAGHISVEYQPTSCVLFVFTVDFCTGLNKCKCGLPHLWHSSGHHDTVDTMALLLRCGRSWIRRHGSTFLLFVSSWMNLVTVRVYCCITKVFSSINQILCTLCAML